MTKSSTNSPSAEKASPFLHKMEVFKKIKRLKCIEPFGVFGFFCFTAFCFVCCFFYLDYRGFTRDILVRSDSPWVLRFGLKEVPEDGLFDFLSEGGNGCNLFEGDWVWDESYPLYQPRDCKFIDAGFRCSENGRPDDLYTKWRWQPKHCNLPRFDAKKMLENLRNRRLVFAGDSIGRNQWESLLCTLSTAVADKDSIYEVNGSPITKHNGFLAFMFKDYNCTVEYYRAPFLVLQSRAPAGAPAKVKMTLKLDIMDWSSPFWKDPDVLILNTGHWWNYEKTLRGGCYFQVGEDVKMNMSVRSAYYKTLETMVKWIDREVNTSKTKVFFRTYAPVHFRGGDWKNGGSCHKETLPELSSTHSLSRSSLTMLKALQDAVQSASPAPRMTILNVTQMTALRKDGHSSLYYLGRDAGPSPLHKQDCSHWCLPGVPDAWNELLYAQFLKLELESTSSAAPG